MRWMARLSAVIVLAIVATGSMQRPDGDWRSFGRDPGAQRFSPLRQIDRTNVSRLAQAWSFDAAGERRNTTSGGSPARLNLQLTPLVVDGTMYITAGSAILALEPETGTVIWRWDAGAEVSRRGVAFWPGNGKRPAAVVLRGGRRADGRRRREDRTRRDRVRQRRIRRSEAGHPRRRGRTVHADHAAGRLRRHPDHRRQQHRRRAGSRPVRRHPRVGCAQRHAALVVSHRAARRRARRRDVGAAKAGRTDRAPTRGPT